MSLTVGGESATMAQERKKDLPQVGISQDLAEISRRAGRVHLLAFEKDTVDDGNGLDNGTNCVDNIHSCHLPSQREPTLNKSSRL